jgi:hypothetical protein
MQLHSPVTSSLFGPYILTSHVTVKIIYLQESLLQNLSTVTSKLLCSLKGDLQKVPRIPCETLTAEQEIARLDMLIGRLLDQADVTTASRLEAMFSHRNQVTCYTIVLLNIICFLSCI